MKKPIVFIVCLFGVLTIKAQKPRTISGEYPRFTFTSGIGTSRMTGLPSGIDDQISLGFRFDFNYNLQLTGRHYLSAGLGYESGRHISDGYFVKNNNQYFFQLTPAFYKHHELIMQYINIPVLYKYRWLNTGSLNVGPFASFLVGSESKYKIQSAKFEADAPVENTFRWGLQAECELLGFNKDSKGGTAIAFGAQYQISGFLKDQKSFKPLSAYFKVGIAIR